MVFTKEELKIILRALTINYIDGPDNEYHAKEMDRIMKAIKEYLGHPLLGQ